MLKQKINTRVEMDKIKALIGLSRCCMVEWRFFCYRTAKTTLNPKQHKRKFKNEFTELEMLKHKTVQKYCD